LSKARDVITSANKIQRKAIRIGCPCFDIFGQRFQCSVGVWRRKKQDSGGAESCYR
jgi:hypothetical protein